VKSIAIAAALVCLATLEAPAVSGETGFAPGPGTLDPHRLNAHLPAPGSTHVYYPLKPGAFLPLAAQLMPDASAAPIIAAPAILPSPNVNR